MSNIRPITLQSCLGKLFFKLLAGTTMKCIDELLDAWEHSRNTNSEQYSIFYDIKQAYDCVQKHVLTRSMRRLRMPAPFIALVADSLTDLESCVRTIYGETRCFPVRRSLRQGDPLAPLLFVILMDALHDGLEVNPFTLRRHGCRLAYPSGTIELPSLGYADDTTVITNSLDDLRAQNDWIKYFMRFNIMRLNPLKCDIVGRRSDGTPALASEIAASDITVDGIALIPIAHDTPIRYLGFHARFDGSCAAQQQKSRAMIIMFTRLAEKFHMPISNAIYMLNVFLLSRLELALHYVHGSGTSKWIQQCDHMFTSCIRRLSSSPMRLSNTVVALSCHLMLPSWLEVSIKASELFLRINAVDERWGGLGRAVMRKELPATVEASTPLPRTNSASRTARAAQLAVTRLFWSLHLREPSRGRRRHMFDAQPLDALPLLEECSSSTLVNLAAGDTHVAHDVWSGWGVTFGRSSVDVYTDGSYTPDPPRSSWSVVIRDRWFDDNYATIPSDESLVRPAHVGGATLIGSSITCTSGIYPAELEAIARALAMFPLSFTLRIHTDSRASMMAIRSFDESKSERYRMRMSARTILRLIHHLMQRRREAGGSTALSHVRAHTTDTDADSVGNRLADYQANRARRSIDRSYPLGMKALPLAQCERWLHLASSATGLIVIDDIRRSARNRMKQQATARWLQYPPPQGLLAGKGTADAGRVVLKHGSPGQQATFVLVASNSIDHHRLTLPDGTSSVQQLQRAACACALSLSHLTICDDATCQSYRRRLQSAILDCLQASGAHPHGSSPIAGAPLIAYCRACFHHQAQQKRPSREWLIISLGASSDCSPKVRASPQCQHSTYPIAASATKCCADFD